MKFTWKLIQFAIICSIVVLFSANLVPHEIFSKKASAATAKHRFPTGETPVQNPLRPADTNSPRDTLYSFLRDLDFIISQRQQQKTLENKASYLAFERALSTMDFSTTPDGNSRIVRAKRLIFLYEILARMELPPETDIPGDDDVTRKSLHEWTIPNTRIKIQRIEKGPRTGEFLFSAGTVQRLHRFYRVVKELPVKAGAKPINFEALIESKDSVFYIDKLVRDLLKPVDTSSPRSTLEGFLESVNRAYHLVMEANAAFRNSPSAISPGRAREIEIMAKNFLGRAEATLDLSKVPQAIREDVGIELVLQLKEIFDRMHLPSIESIPDIEMVNYEKQQNISLRSGDTRPVRWRYPNTTIEIVEIIKGEQQGKFLFSEDTVSHIGEFYQKVRKLPYRGDYGRIALEYDSPGISTGFYEYFIAMPGLIIPQTRFLGRLINSLPGWFKTVYGSQALWRSISLFSSLIFVVLLLVVSHRVLLRHPRELSTANRQWRRFFFNLFSIGVIYSFFWILEDTVKFTGPVFMAVRTCLTLLVWYFWASGVLFLCNAVAETIVKSPKIDPEDIQASHIRALFGVVGFIAGATIFITGLSRVGLSLIPLLAGAGIGGLAIALAARPTLENVIGGFMIFLDKPYQVGQRVKVMGQDGTVESIGLRSTKIRLLSGHLTSIPNEKMAAVEIENIGRRPFIRRLFNISITYDTPPEKINRALEILKEILSVPESMDSTSYNDTQSTDYPYGVKNRTGYQSHPNEAINQERFPPRVFFNELNADSLNILVIYWYHPAKYWDYLEHATWINMQIMERFRVEDIDFAFPSQTLYMAGDDKRPLTIGQPWISDSAEETSKVDSSRSPAGASRQPAPDHQIRASDSLRPQVKTAKGLKSDSDGTLTDAPLEDSVLQSGGQGPEGAAADNEDSDR